MEYEIYLLCNVLGIIILFLVILFHFIDADSENSKSYEKEIETKDESTEEPKRISKKQDKKKSKN
jgi:Na+-transporting methylmalonyl-CoA/oxaloacetate decarboxylase gamma subunit